MRATVVPLSIAVIFLASPSVAQDFSPTFAGDMAMHTVIGNQLERDSRRSASPARSSAAPVRGTTSARSSASTAYRPSAAIRERVETQYLGFLGRVAPADVEIVRADLARFDAPDAWSRIVSRTGLRSGDVADAMASYWILNWMIANNETADRPDDRARAAAVRRQVGAIIAGNPTFAAMDDAQKQEMAEALMLNFIYQHKSFSEAARANDSDLQGRLADAALARFRDEMGVNLRQLSLTDQGFVSGA